VGGFEASKRLNHALNPIPGLISCRRVDILYRLDVAAQAVVAVGSEPLVPRPLEEQHFLCAVTDVRQENQQAHATRGRPRESLFANVHAISGMGKSRGRRYVEELRLWAAFC